MTTETKYAHVGATEPNGAASTAPTYTLVTDGSGWRYTTRCACGHTAIVHGGLGCEALCDDDETVECGCDMTGREVQR